eukprot:1146056-Pleurochrysis_carterae.AAC.1
MGARYHGGEVPWGQGTMGARYHGGEVLRVRVPSSGRRGARIHAGAHRCIRLHVHASLFARDDSRAYPVA